MGAGSAGVWGLSVAEVESHQLCAVADPLAATEDAPPNPAHALIDFRDVAVKQWKKAGQRLKLSAVARGMLHRPAE